MAQGLSLVANYRATAASVRQMCRREPGKEQAVNDFAPGISPDLNMVNLHVKLS